MEISILQTDGLSVRTEPKKYYKQTQTNKTQKTWGVHLKESDGTIWWKSQCTDGRTSSVHTEQKKNVTNKTNKHRKQELYIWRELFPSDLFPSIYLMSGTVIFELRLNYYATKETLKQVTIYSICFQYCMRWMVRYKAAWHSIFLWYTYKICNVIRVICLLCCMWCSDQTTAQYWQRILSRNSFANIRWIKYGGVPLII
jgi:hypothetical protein